MVDACTSNGILPFYGPFGDIKDTLACETQFRAAFLLGCVGAWSLHPAQIDIAKKVFSPDPDEVRFAKKVIEAIPDGRGVHMIDGKMQDDATWKQCQVMVHLAELLAKKDPELAEAYGFTPHEVLRVRVPPDRQAGRDPHHQVRFRHHAGGGAGHRRRHRRPGGDQVAGALRRADEGRRGAVRRHPRRGRRPRRGTCWRWRSTATCRAACSSTPGRRWRRSTTPAWCGTECASSR